MYEMNDIQNPSGADNDEHTNIINDLDSEITQEEILKVIQSLKTNKSPGLDGLISEIFKSYVHFPWKLLTSFSRLAVVLSHGLRVSFPQKNKKATWMMWTITVQSLR